MSRVEVRAVVTLTIEVEPSDRWGQGTTIEQVRSQAIEGALDRLGAALKNTTGIRVNGAPRVNVVSFDPDQQA